MSRAAGRFREALATVGFVLSGFALAALAVAAAYVVVAFALPLLLGVR